MTALAHGEGSPEERSRWSRHLLTCLRCRAQHASAQAVLLALADLGAARSTHAPAPPVPPMRRASRRLATSLVLPPLVASVLIALLLPLRPEGPLVPPGATFGPAAATDTSAQPPTATPRSDLAARARGRLVATQARDGRWPAEGPGGAATDDVSATSLGLLALLNDGAPALEEPATLEAVALATRWLETRAGSVAADAARGLDGLRAEALASAALLRAAWLRPDARTQRALEELVPALLLRGLDGANDHATRPWVAYAFSEAQRGGWRAARRALRQLEAIPAARAPSADRLAGVAGTPAGAPRGDCTPIELALSMLEAETPVRTLAMAPVCRLETDALLSGPRARR